MFHHPTKGSTIMTTTPAAKTTTTRAPRTHQRAQTPPDPHDTRDGSPDARDRDEPPENARDAIVPTSPPPSPVTAKAEREALRAAGMKRCPAHARLLDRLPDEARQAVGGYDDVSIRPLSEYQKSTSTCRACDHVIQADWRAAHKQPAPPAGPEEQRALLAKLTAQREQLDHKIATLTQSLDAQQAHE